MNYFQKIILNDGRMPAFCIAVSLLSLTVVSQETAIDTLSVKKTDAELEPSNEINSPLNTPDVSSPRATLLSFIDHMNASFELLMDAHVENLELPEFYIDESVKPKAYETERCFEKASYSLDLSSFPLSLRKYFGYCGPIMLKEIVDRIDLPAIEEVPRAESLNSIHEENFESSFYTIPDTEKILITRQGFILTRSMMILSTSLSSAEHFPHNHWEFKEHAETINFQIINGFKRLISILLSQCDTC